MEVDHSSRQTFVVVGGGRRHVEVRAAATHWRRAQGNDDQVEPEAPIHVHYREAGPGTSDDDDARPRTAATSSAIFGLKEVRAGDALEPECPVCLRDFDAEETLRAMPCSHAFHQRCISQWLRRNGVCPLCRYQLPTEQEEESSVYPRIMLVVRC